MGTLILNASGQVDIYKYTPAKELILTRKNTILPLALDVVARLLGNFNIGKVDIIKITNAGLAISSGIITIYEHPALNQVRYSAFFNKASFNSYFDKIELIASSMGPIAQIIGIAGQKTDQQELSISWTITISTP